MTACEHATVCQSVRDFRPLCGCLEWGAFSYWYWEKIHTECDDSLVAAIVIRSPNGLTGRVLVKYAQHGKVCAPRRILKIETGPGPNRKHFHIRAVFSGTRPVFSADIDAPNREPFKVLTEYALRLHEDHYGDESPRHQDGERQCWT